MTNKKELIKIVIDDMEANLIDLQRSAELVKFEVSHSKDSKIQKFRDRANSLYAAINKTISEVRIFSFKYAEMEAEDDD